MLPAAARLRRRDEFAAALRAGRRRSGGRGTPLLVVHLAPADDVSAASPTRAGFVVSKAVGPAVVRNRVRRRLRHLVGVRLASLPAGSRLVVRALPSAAQATFDQLAAALDDALRPRARSGREG